MNEKEAFGLFDLMIDTANKELFNFTLSSQFSIESKADKSVVTACDQSIDKKLTKLAEEKGLQVVSEEGELLPNNITNSVKTGLSKKKNMKAN